MFNRMLAFIGHGFLLSNFPRNVPRENSQLSYLPDSVSEHGTNTSNIIKNLFANHTLASLNHTTKQEAFVRCTYTASIDELGRSYEKIPEKFQDLLKEDSEHTKHIAENFHKTRRHIGHYYKNKTEEIYPESIRQIKIRNLMKYRDELGPTYESLKNGIGKEKDSETKHKLVNEFGLNEEEIKFYYTNKTKTDLQIIESSTRTDGSDFDKPTDYHTFVSTCKPNIKSFPVKIADFLSHLKDSVYIFANNQTLHEIVHNKTTAKRPDANASFLSRIKDEISNKTRDFR